MPLLLRRSPATLALLVAIAVGFLAETFVGVTAADLGWLEASMDPRVLVLLGANYGPAVAAGEWWRLVTSMFLHIGVVHLLVNSWALFQLGALMEHLAGRWPYLGVYFLTGVAGSLASFFWNQGLSAGASGAIFGILGALIAILARHRRRLTRAARGLLQQLLFWAGLNVYLGFQISAIDNAAHLGGFAAGLLAGLLVRPDGAEPAAAPPPAGWPPEPHRGESRSLDGRHDGDEGRHPRHFG